MQSANFVHLPLAERRSASARVRMSRELGGRAIDDPDILSARAVCVCGCWDRPPADSLRERASESGRKSSRGVIMRDGGGGANGCYKGRTYGPPILW